jgi:hypothetical protein
MTEHHHSSADMPFTEAELQELHTQDYLAGQRVVGLMLGIFVIGVILYTIVAVTVAGG